MFFSVQVNFCCKIVFFNETAQFVLHTFSCDGVQMVDWDAS